MARTKQRDSYHEIEDIREDLESLKSNVVELTRHVKENGAESANALAEITRHRFEKIKNQGERQLHKMERRIKTHPGQSVLAAFVAGFIASVVINGRR